jgi:hypothetical protein
MFDQIKPTDLSQFIRLNGCQRFLHFKLHPDRERSLRERYGVRPRQIAPLLERAGKRFEDEVRATLIASYRVVNLANAGMSATLATLAEVDHNPVILDQAALEGQLGQWHVAGRADLIEASRGAHGDLRILIADVKASHEEHLEHRVQVATYALLLQAACRQAGLPLVELAGAIVHRGTPQSLAVLRESSQHFDLEPYMALVQALVEGEDAPLQRAAQMPLEAIPFALTTRCDGCQFNTVCLPHAAEYADVALVPDVGRAVRNALAAHEVHTLQSLAALKSAPHLTSELANRLALMMRDPVLAPQVDHLAARAGALLRRLDPNTPTPSPLPNHHLPVLPDPAAYPQLIQIFLDLQADDVSGLVYLAAALIKGPNGERAITHIVDAPPTAESEAALLTMWADELEAALRDLAATDAPPLHLVVYDRRAQRIALEACARNEAHHALLSVLVTWLQEQPQVQRATCARLREVIGQQHNLPLTCDSLYAVATRVWVNQQPFRWRTATHDFQRLFRTDIFDHSGRFVRDGSVLRTAKPGEEGVLLEAASRFNSQIPSEYAYAAWQHKSGSPAIDDIVAFAAHRLRALEHLAAACQQRSHNLDVPLLPLSQLPIASTPPDLATALQTFLDLEHVAALADLLAHVRLPLQRRLLTGRTALLEAIFVEPNGQRACFRFTTLPGGGYVPPRFKVGDWAVLNELDDHAGPWQIIRGRLVIISAMTEETIELELTTLNSAGRFKYNHDSKLKIKPRYRYMLDEPADDLLGDRVHEALDHLGTNPLATWLDAPRAASSAAVFDQSSLSTTAERLLTVTAATPTAAQREVITGGADLPLRLVQGPPGTGKSHTLGLAVVSRLLAAAQAHKPLHVAVTAKTHSAVQVALDSIAKAWRSYTNAASPPLPLADLPIVKLGGDASASRAAGVRWMDPRKGKKDLRAILEGAAVLGGTPGGLDTLLKTIDTKTRWNGHFDVLLIDEASQMSMPEGLLAASVLQQGGQIIVVGDHRQMPPIIMHAWNDVAGSLARWQPERSLFKWLLDAGAPRVALDQSFRLHRDHAAFLQDAIYRADGVHFHSRRTNLLPPHEFDDPFVAAVLRPDVPLVVVEHNEHGSRQSNDFEAALVADLVRSCMELGLDRRDGIGVVVPHRAQKAALRARLPELANADSIDTVERFQGGERDVIIVACTASDSDYVSAEAEFLLDPQRLNVALSRARKKLIVVASSSVFNAMPTELPIFERAVLWKRLHAYAAPQVQWRGTRHENVVTVMGPLATQLDPE